MPASDIHVGHDGWIFLVGGSNDALRLYTEEDQVPAATLRDWRAAIRGRIALAAEVGARYVHLVAPEKLAVYPALAGLGLPDRPAGPGARLEALLRAEGLGRHVADLAETLRRAAADAPVYMRTDTHWTYEGIRAVYAEACLRLGLTPAAPVPGRERIDYEGVFDLGGKADPPVAERALHLPFLPGITRVRENAIAALWDEAARTGQPVRIHNALHAVYRNDRPDAQDGRVVLFGDSFVDFRPTTLSSLFIEQFRETHVVWSTSLDHDYVRRVRPTILVTENAERFMRVAPDDDYQFEADAARRIAALTETM